MSATTMTERATVDYLRDAKVGDKIWVFDANSRYLLNGEYYGRGTYSLEPVAKVTHLSVIIMYGDKFDKKTGRQRGDFLIRSAYGEKEREARDWLNTHKHRLEGTLSRERDIDKLKAIAAILGYEQ